MVILNKGKYNKNQWNEPIDLTKEKMDKIENALSYTIDMDVKYKKITNDIFNLSTDKYQYLTIDKDLTINLPILDYDMITHLFLNCEQELKIKFISSGDERSVYLPINLYDIELIYIGEWIVKI
ncbi:MAG: hypothetical protein ACLR4X_04745 [Clostridia bacterium]|nr:MAG TPA: hypothetical protein [Caudoviricetes sp.]